MASVSFFIFVLLFFFLCFFAPVLFLLLHPYTSCSLSLSLTLQLSSSFTESCSMESALQARPSGIIEPLCFEKAHTSLYHVDAPVLPTSSGCPITTSAAPKQTTAMLQDPSPAPIGTQETQEEECLVDCQPICFKENPFLVANRKSKGCPLEERILSRPPTGYGRQGQLQTWLYNKASPWAVCLWLSALFWKQHGPVACHPF